MSTRRAFRLTPATLPNLRRQFNARFPKARREALWKEAEPRHYSRKVDPTDLIWACLRGFVLRASGLRTLKRSPGLDERGVSTVAMALRQPAMLGYVKRLVQDLQLPADAQAWGEEPLETLDGMPLTLPKTRRHDCPKVNNKTVGGGVVWAYRPDAAPDGGTGPVRVLKVVGGAWHDTRIMREVELTPKGPVYVMDRGFYALDLVQGWLDEEVRFVMRVRQKDLQYKVLERHEAPAKVGKVQVLLDARVSVGGPEAEVHPEVRLIHAVLPTGEGLVLATNRSAWSTQRVLEAYKRRHEIEQFHRFLKDTLGLAHLYSFAWDGIQFLLYVALLAASLLLMLAQATRTQMHATIDRLQAELEALRTAAGLGPAWRRNMVARRRSKAKPPKDPGLPKSVSTTTLATQKGA